MGFVVKSLIILGVLFASNFFFSGSPEIKVMAAEEGLPFEH
jgi:hypothetical protein